MLSGAIMHQAHPNNQNVFYQQHGYQQHMPNNGTYSQFVNLQQVQQPEQQNEESTYYFK